MGVRQDKIQLIVEINGQKAGGSIKDLRAEARKLKRAMDNATDPKDVERYANDLKKVNTRLSDIRSKYKAVQNEASGLNRLTGLLKASVIGLVAAFSFRKVISGFQNLIGVTANFQRSMSEVRSVIADITDEQFKKLEDKAKELGSTTSKSATEAAQGLKFLALAGFSVEEQLTAIEPVLRLSEASGLDLARASDLATDSMSALGLEADELNGYLDIIVNTQSRANTSTGQLLEAFVAAGGTLKDYNVSLEESSALMAVMANRGIKGAEAGNSFNTVMINLATGAGKAGKAMKALGINAFDNEGQFRGVTQVLQDVNEKLKGYTPEAQKVYKSMISGKTQVKAFNALLAGAAEELTGLTNELGNSDNKLNDIAQQMQDNYKGAVSSFKSALEGLIIAIGERLLPVLTKMVQAGTTFIGVIRSIPAFIKENRVAIGALVIAIASLNQQAILAAANKLRLAAQAKLATIATTAQTAAQRGLNTAMKANPIGLVISALALLVSGIDLAYRKSSTFRAGIEGLKNVASEAFSIIAEAVNSFIEGWESLKEGNIRDALKSFGEGLIKTNPVTIAFTEGGRLKEAYKKGFKESKEADLTNAEAEQLLEDLDKLNDPAFQKGQQTRESFDQGLKGLEGLQGEKKDPKAKTKKKDVRQTGTAQASIISNAYEALQKNVEKNLEEIDQAADKTLDEHKIRFLQKMLTEQEYQELSYQSEVDFIQQKLDLLEQYGLQETEAFRKLQIEQLEIQKEYDDKKAENAKRTSDLKTELAGLERDAAGKALNFAIRLFGKDEEARKKNAGALKAFEIAKTDVNLYSEIQGIWKNAKISLPEPFATILAAAQTAFSIGRANKAKSAIASKKFFFGGHTGNQSVYHDGLDGVAGLVHVGEWVAPKWQLSDPETRPYIDHLENIRRKKTGFFVGGFTAPDTTPNGILDVPLTGNPSGQSGFEQLNQTMTQVLGAVLNLPRVQKAFVVNQEIKAADQELSAIIEESSI